FRPPAGGEGKLGNRNTARRELGLGVFAEISHENDFIDASGHNILHCNTGGDEAPAPRAAYTCISPMPVSRREFLMGSLALPALAAKKPKLAPEKPSILLIVVDNLPSWL